MLRVLETIARSSQAGKFVDERKDLVSWIDEILVHAWAFQVRSFGVPTTASSRTEHQHRMRP